VILDDLVGWIDGHHADEVFIEGVGGWAVPLSWTLLVAELAQALAAPVLVVAADRLGVLNHTLLTVAAIRAAGLPLAGVVLNAVAPSAGGDPSRQFNFDDLGILLPGVAVASMPYLPDLSRALLKDAGLRLRAGLGF
jgi:dethiobiotin synthetase